MPLTIVLVFLAWCTGVWFLLGFALAVMLLIDHRVQSVVDFCAVMVLGLAGWVVLIYMAFKSAREKSRQ